MLRRRARAATLLALGATLTALAPVLTPTGAGAAPPPNSTERVSVDYNGGDADNPSTFGVLSADGNSVLFHSTASDIVNGPAEGTYVRNLTTGVTTALPYNMFVNTAWLTGNGSKVVFETTQGDLVPGDTNGTSDVFMYDLAAGTTTRVSVDSNGAQYNYGISGDASVSDDGRYVAFVTTTAQNATCQNNRVSVRDMVTGKTKVVMRCAVNAEISGDGSALLVSTQITDPSCQNIHVVQLATSASTTIGCGESLHATISGNGDVVAIRTGDTGIQVVDVATGAMERIDVADDGTPSNGHIGLTEQGPALSADGQIVAFMTNATTLLPGDSSIADVYVRDRAAGTTRRISVAPDGTPGDLPAGQPDISADGTLVSFHSNATNLVAGDTNSRADVFVRKLAPSACATATPTLVGTPGNDTLTGTAGNEVLLGLGGDDTIRGQGGNDVICGGAGSDTASFAGSAALIDADLALGTATGQGSDTLYGIENLEGSAYADKLKGDAGPNRFTGLGGADAISGFGGDDWMDGGVGNDKLYGHAGRDTLMGGIGNDLLSGGLDVDSLDGGDGIDTCGGDATDTPVTGCEG